jgi:hypothetical protein
LLICQSICYLVKEAAVRQTERLSTLIGDVHDAALDPALWVDVLDKTARFVGGPAASLYSRDAVSRAASAAYQFGLDPRYVRLYVEEYARLDPTLPGYFFAEIEQPVHVPDVMPYDEFLQTRFYKEWSRPQGIVDSVNVVLDRSATTAAMFVVFRHERDGLVDEEARRRMRLIVPHIRRAVLIGRVIELKKAEAATFADTLDGISAGMFLVDAQGCIVHANASGHLLLAGGSLLHAVGRKLSTHDTSAEQALHEVFLAAGNGDTAVGVKGVALPLRARDGDHYVAHVLPLTSGVRRRAGTNYRGGAGGPLSARGHSQDLQTDPNRVAGAAGHRPGRGRS